MIRLSLILCLVLLLAGTGAAYTCSGVPTSGSGSALFRRLPHSSGCSTAQTDCAALTTLAASIWTTSASECTIAACIAFSASSACNCWSDGWTASSSQGLFRISAPAHYGQSNIGKGWSCPNSGTSQQSLWYNPTRNMQCAWIIRNASGNWADWSFLSNYQACITNPVSILGCACPGYQTTTTSTTRAATTSRASTTSVSTSTTAAVTTSTRSATTSVAQTTTAVTLALTSTTLVSTSVVLAGTTAAVATTTVVVSATTSAARSTTEALSASTVAAASGSATATAAVAANAAASTTAAALGASAAASTTTVAAVTATTVASSTTVSTSLSALSALSTSQVSSLSVSSSLLATATAALSTAAATTTTGALTLPPVECNGPPPLPSAVCLNGNWIIADPTVNSNETITVTTPIIFLGNATLGGTIVIEPTDPAISPLSGIGCVNVNGALNVTLPDNTVLPPSLYVINSSCVQGNFSSVNTNYKTPCKGKKVAADQQNVVGHGLSILFSQKGDCKSSFLWWIVAIVIAAAIATAIILVVIIVVLIHRRPSLLRQTTDDENIHFKLMEENGNNATLAPLPPSGSNSVHTSRRSNMPTIIRGSPTAQATKEALAGGLTLPYNKSLPTPPSNNYGDDPRMSLLASAVPEPETDPRFSAPPQWISSPQAAAAEPGPFVDRGTEAGRTTVMSSAPRSSGRQTRISSRQSSQVPDLFVTAPAWPDMRLSMPPPSEPAPAPADRQSIQQPRLSSIPPAAADAEPMFSTDSEPAPPSRLTMPLPANDALAPRASVLLDSLLTTNPDDPNDEQRISLLLASVLAAQPPDRYSSNSFGRLSLPSPGEPAPPSAEANEEADLLAAIAESDAALEDTRASESSMAPEQRVSRVLDIIGEQPRDSERGDEEPRALHGYDLT